jgi:flagellar basal body-associated protein FliL
MVEETDENPYDFFMEQQKAKSSRLGNIGTSPIKKLVMIVGLVVVVLGLVAVIIAIATKPTTQSTALVTIAQDQAEIIRVAGDAVKNSHSDVIQNFAATATVGLASSQQDLLSYMAKNGTKVNDKVLALGHSSKTDQALTAALAADTYDTSYESIMRANLSKYEHDINQGISAAQTKQEVTLLQKANSGAQLLQTMLPQPQ